MYLHLKALASSAVLICATLATTGCANSFNPAPEEGISQPGVALTGTVMGGQQPIVGAHVYLMAAGVTGYASAATSLLTHGDGTDAHGTYVLTTFPFGGFDLTGDYTCTSGQQVYVVATGGNPGLTGNFTNNYISQVAALGACPTGGTFAGQIPSISISENTTVAAAYALAPFTTDSFHIGSAATAASRAGLTNAMESAMQIVSSYTAVVPATTAAVAGFASPLSANGTVPQTKIFTIADILSQCVNSDGTGGACSTLSANALDGSGIAPTDTFTAAVNMAQHPTQNVTNLYNIISKTPPFEPTLTSAPADLTLAVTFTAPHTSTPTRAAVDANGNLWFPNKGNNSLTELSPTGVVLSGAGGFTGNGLSTPWAAAIDPTDGSIFVPNSSAASSVSRFNSSGGSMISYGTVKILGLGDIQTFYNVAFDNSGTPYVGSSNGVYVIGFLLGTLSNSFASGTSYGVAVSSANKAFGASNTTNALTSQTGFLLTGTSSSTGGGLTGPTGMAIDHSGQFWIANGGANSISVFNSTGAAITGSPGYTGGGINAPWGIAVDGDGNVITANSNGTISKLTSSGTALSPSVGFKTASTGIFYSAVIDASGNVWAPNTDGKIYKFLGLAAPVTTPLSPATLGIRP